MENIKESPPNELLTCLVKGFLDLILELFPVPVSHGWVFQVLDEWHGSFESVDPNLQRRTDSPISLILDTAQKSRDNNSH